MTDGSAIIGYSVTRATSLMGIIAGSRVMAPVSDGGGASCISSVNSLIGADTWRLD